jgi:hypothetical protein
MVLYLVSFSFVKPTSKEGPCSIMEVLERKLLQISRKRKLFARKTNEC